MSRQAVATKRSNTPKKVTPRPGIDPLAYYSIKQAALAVNLAEITVWRAILSGNLETHRTGRKRIISGAQIHAWIEAGGKTSRIKKGAENKVFD